MESRIIPLFIYFFTILNGTIGVIHFAEEKSQFLLTCEVQEGWSPRYWMLHEDGIIRGKAFQVGQDYEKEEIKVFFNGTLMIKNVKQTHDGTHLCVAETQTQGQLEGIPIRMYVKPQIPDNLWEAKYQAQFIVGLLSALVVAVLLGGSCLVYRFRWRPEDAEPLTKCIDEGHENPGLDREEAQSTIM